MREICRRSMAAMQPRCLPGLPRPRQLSYCLRRRSMPTRPVATHHRQLREEVVILKEGKLRLEIEGEESKDVTAGGAIYVAFNKMHAWTNAGDSTATYFVVEIGNGS